jgi:hypothetical protein
LAACHLEGGSIVRTALLSLLAAVPAWALSASAAPLTPAKPSQIVTLITTGTVCPSGGLLAVDQQVLPDGSIAPFTIPPRRVLIVTEVSWLILGGTPSSTATFGLRSETAAATDDPTFFFDSGTTNAQGGSGNLRSVANAVVASGATLCLVGSTGQKQVTVRGFIAKDK